ncbi:DMT family transporter [Spongisporangium articulatum]|uniref:DMT family transporter n=1 Tax=Spongisporangium articulatum TaxID=3362603 RepID=A0ABW8ARN9_9ACTN
MFVSSALLALAITIEVATTAVLPKAQGFHDPFWSAVVVVGYASCTWLLTVVVKNMPVSVAYAVWAGGGTALVAVVGTAWLGEPMGPVKMIALALIVGGVVLLNLGDTGPGAHGDPAAGAGAASSRPAPDRPDVLTGAR